jgi:hypothetical protein
VRLSALTRALPGPYKPSPQSLFTHHHRNFFSRAITPFLQHYRNRFSPSRCLCPFCSRVAALLMSSPPSHWLSVLTIVCRETVEGRSPTEVETTALLTPNDHLTDACWRDFNRFVKSFDGWSATRRPATIDDVVDLGFLQKKKAFWIDVTYVPPGAKKPRRAAKTASPDGAAVPERTDAEQAAYESKKKQWWRDYLQKHKVWTQDQALGHYVTLTKWYGKGCLAN